MKEFFRRKLQWVVPAFSLWGLLLYRILAFLLPDQSSLQKWLLPAGVFLLVLLAIAFASQYERRNDGKVYRIKSVRVRVGVRVSEGVGESEVQIERSGKKLKKMILIAVLLHLLFWLIERSI